MAMRTRSTYGASAGAGAGAAEYAVPEGDYVQPAIVGADYEYGSALQSSAVVVAAVKVDPRPNSPHYVEPTSIGGHSNA